MLTERTRRILEATRGKNDHDNIFYQFVGSACEYFRNVMLPNETFIFDNPCDRCPGYVIYAIYNYDGIIMVDTILNANKNKGIHSITSKGTESLNMYDAMVRYYLGKGTSEINPNNNRKNVYIGV